MSDVHNEEEVKLPKKLKQTRGTDPKQRTRFLKTRGDTVEMVFSFSTEDIHIPMKRRLPGRTNDKNSEDVIVKTDVSKESAFEKDNQDKGMNLSQPIETQNEGLNNGKINTSFGM